MIPSSDCNARDFLTPILVVLCSFLCSNHLVAGEDFTFFETRIRPVLAEHCYECHSTSAAERKKLKGGLRLDTGQATLLGGESGAAVVPGKADQSLLISALRHEDGIEMPPKGKLPDHVIGDFVKWIELGAPDPRATQPENLNEGRGKSSSTETHWAFVLPQSHSKPSVTAENWPNTELDYFVLAKLEANGLVPVRPATNRELIRRLTFDLIGLPPTFEEVQAFVRDDSPQALRRVIDRLLTSPHYGERWGRYWLDVARYADDKALAYHNPWPHAYRYRDWVVKALNEDMPYDYFVRLQLAGDLLPEPVTDYTQRLAALGFQGLGAFYHKGNVAKQVMADELDDRIDTLSRGLLGLTAACARCHDHKYDPISTQDYYSLAAAYNGASWSEVALDSPEAIKTHQTWSEAKKKQEDELAKWLSGEARQIARRELGKLDRYLLRAWQIRVGIENEATTQPTPNRIKLEQLFVSRCTTLLEKSNLKKLPPPISAWVRMARRTAPGNAGDDKIVPDSLQAATDELKENVEIAFREYDHHQRETKQQDSNPDEGEKTNSPQLNPEHKSLLNRLWDGKTALFGVSAKEVSGLFGDAQRVDHQRRKDELEKHIAAAPPEPPRSHGVVGGGAAMRIHVRGSVKQLGELAPPGFLPVLQNKDSDRPQSETFTRLDLADSICTADNPLTARVIVNRVWQHHFGQGIVSTASNFGMFGDPPSHPQLLDTLTVRFMQSGWSLKWLHREILSSATYQLSSRFDSQAADVAQHEYEAIDPANRMLWRFTPRRLELESWRDAMLAVSGQLDCQIGGPSAGRAETGHARRTIYSTISRREPDKMLVAFDFPDANVTTERRDVTTVPQQQLFVLNSPFMTDAATALANRVGESAKEDSDRIELLYELILCRAPSHEETNVAEEFVRAATKGAKGELRAWDQLAQAMLAANEFCWID